MEKIPFEDAQRLCSDPNSGFVLISREHHIALPPKCLDDISRGVRQQLDDNIGFFLERFGGALISYSNIRLLGDKGQIIDDSPFIHFRIKADFILFKPIVGSCLRGVVNKVGKDHIGFLVHNHFNASVPLSHTGQEDLMVTKGDICSFVVAQLYMHRGMLSLRGEKVCKVTGDSQ